MQIPVLIIDDNESAAGVLATMLSEYSEFRILNSVSSLSEASLAINLYQPALLFIDIELPDGNGIEFYESLRDQMPWNIYAIFYTAFDKYAIDALRVRAHDYLLKPIVKADVQNVIHRFLVHCTNKLVNSDHNSTQFHQNPVDNTMLVVDNKNNKIAIKPSDVGFFHYLSDRKVWEVHCVDMSTYILRHGVNAGHLLQTSGQFEQVHKSYIVNTNVIASMDDNSINLIPPFNKNGKIPVSRLYRNTLYNHFLQL